MGDPARKSKRSHADEYLRLGYLPIPLNVKTKKPAVYHIPVQTSEMTFGPPQWTRKEARAFGDRWDAHQCGAAKYDIGILLDNNSVTKRCPFVIDCDTEVLFRLLEKRFPEFVAACGLAKTSKGFHVWSWRSKYADQNAIYDNFKIYIGVDHHGDVKTVTKSSREYVDAKGRTRTHTTPGNIAVFPSANKQWRRLPEPEGPEVDDAVVDWLLELASSHAASGASKKRSRGAPRVRVPDVLDAHEVVFQNCGPWTPTPERDLECLRGMGFSINSGSAKRYTRTYKNPPSTATTFTCGCYQFMDTGSVCPICKTAGHSNHYYVLYTPTERRVFNFSSKCNIRGGRPIEWSTAGRSAWKEALVGTPYERLADARARQISLPREAHLYAPAILEMAPAGERWTLGNFFKPSMGAQARDPSVVGEIVIKAGDWGAQTGSTFQAIIYCNARILVKDTSTGRFKELTPAAQDVLDAQLGRWFASSFPEYVADKDGCFTIPACRGISGTFAAVHPTLRQMVSRRHAGCSTVTRRPWTFLAEIAAHLELRPALEPL
jgi:hypothetical protein